MQGRSCPEPRPVRIVMQWPILDPLLGFKYSSKYPKEEGRQQEAPEEKEAVRSEEGVVLGETQPATTELQKPEKEKQAKATVLNSPNAATL